VLFRRGLPLLFLQNIASASCGRREIRGRRHANDGRQDGGTHVACAQVPKLPLIIGGLTALEIYGVGRAYSPVFLFSMAERAHYGDWRPSSVRANASHGQGVTADNGIAAAKMVAGRRTPSKAPIRGLLLGKVQSLFRDSRAASGTTHHCTRPDTRRVLCGWRFLGSAEPAPIPKYRFA